jgi:hypothetical protein
MKQDGSAKATLLSGMANFVQCPNCGYQGNLATPIVYHDPDKEMLLTFVPPELGLPQPEQERLVGALINQVVNNLAPEQRKGYLLRPQAQLTMQGLVEYPGSGWHHPANDPGPTTKLNLLQRFAHRER